MKTDSVNTQVPMSSIKSLTMSLRTIYDHDESGRHFETIDKLIEETRTQR